MVLAFTGRLGRERQGDPAMMKLRRAPCRVVLPLMAVLIVIAGCASEGMQTWQGRTPPQPGPQPAHVTCSGTSRWNGYGCTTSDTAPRITPRTVLAVPFDASSLAADEQWM